ncbi:MAG: DUF1501 domain-containing protein [Polyangiaceae bacterium]
MLARGQVSIPELKLLEGLSPLRLDDRRSLLAQLDETRRKLSRAELEQWDGVHQRAFQLLRGGDTLNAFDLSQETPATRARFGKTSFGQSCLLGRRLVEAGVPFVQVNWSQFAEVFYPFSDYGWDTHADNFGLLAEWHGPLLDQALSTLLADLQDAACSTARWSSAWASSAERRESTASAREITGIRVIFRYGPAAAFSRDARSAKAMSGASIPKRRRPRRKWRESPCSNCWESVLSSAELKVLEGGRVIEELL